MTTRLLYEYKRHINALKARSVAITDYQCPNNACTGPRIETRAAPVGEYWDTISTCPYCNTLHMKWTRGANAFAEMVPA